ncbi:MAG TPA: MFS transporter [Povalibacter sp.]|nr:MFS transporter [Povalibacter sp.]
MSNALPSALAAPVIGRTHKLSLLIALYLAQGLPYGFFTQALPVLLREAGYSLKAISAMSLLYLPWALKFLWAPYLDHLGTRKQWLLLWQISSVCAALLLTRLDLGHGYTIVLAAAFVFNIIAASQDIVTDGLAVRILDSQERGLANGIQVGAYRLGMILGGGLLLWIFAKTDWATMFFCMALLLALTIIPVVSMSDAPRACGPPPRLRELLVGWLRRMLMPGMLAFAGLIFCYRFGDAMVSNILGPFLRDAGLSKETIALMKGTVGSVTSLAGALLGGWFMFRVSRRNALLITGLAQAATFILYIVAALGIGGIQLLWTATILEGVIGTTATVALFTLMMDASDPEHAGTDYTLFASFFVLVNAVGTFCSSVIADAAGYAPAFVTGTVLAALGCITLVRVLDRKPVPERVAKAWLLTSNGKGAGEGTTH